MPRPDIPAIDRVIWSADVGTMPKLVKYLRAMPNLKYVKIDRLFAETNGLNCIGFLREAEVEVFDDGKLVEVPTKVEGLIRLHAEQRPWMSNCMASICSNGVLEDPDKPELVDALKTFADVCNIAGILPCGVTVLTSKTAEVVAKEYHRELDPENPEQVCIDQVLEYVGMLERFGFTDVVCSADEVEAIRADSRFDRLCLKVPGVRLPGSDPGDQARVGTPAYVIGAGGDRVIVGREISNAEDPGEALARIVANIETAIAAV